MDHKEVNRYVDVLASHLIEDDANQLPHYKTRAYTQASLTISLFDVCQCIDQVLEFDAVKKIELIFDQEEDDEANQIYPFIALHVHYENEQLHEERFCDHPQFVEFLNTSDEEKQNLKHAFTQLLHRINHVSDGDYFEFQKTLDIIFFDKDTTATQAFAQNFPNEFALIEKTSINDVMPINSSSQKSKM